MPVQLFCVGLPCALEARSSDLGPGGVCVDTPSPFDLSSLRRVSIELPDGLFQTKAVGRWQREEVGRPGQQSGIEFQELEREEVERLWRFVHQRAGELASFLRDRSTIGPMELDEALDLALFTRVAEYPAGNWIHRQGPVEPVCESAFVVYDGSVVLEASTRSGRTVHVARVEAGEVFGALPIVGGISHITSAVADRDAILLEIDAATYRFLQAEKPQTARLVTEALVRAQAAHLSSLIERLGEG
jgi:CRP-like cAMP-binding protein